MRYNIRTRKFDYPKFDQVSDQRVIEDLMILYFNAKPSNYAFPPLSMAGLEIIYLNNYQVGWGFMVPKELFSDPIFALCNHIAGQEKIPSKLALNKIFYHVKPIGFTLLENYDWTATPTASPDILVWVYNEFMPTQIYPELVSYSF